MQKIDLKKELDALYRASAKAVVQVDVPPLRYLMIDGQGDPNTAPAYAEAVESLFSVSYAAKFLFKKQAQGLDYAVMPLEGLWWSDDLSAFVRGDRSMWRWTMMVLQPDLVPAALIHEAIEQVRRKKGLPALDALRLERFHEGLCAQTLHLGPFTEEGPTIERVHRYIAERGALRGKHHEVYLSDVRRAAPSKWKTVIRQPMVLERASVSG